MMIFHEFPDNKRAINFMRCVERSYGRKAQLFHSQEQSNKVDPFPFELTAPIVLVERRDDCSGGRRDYATGRQLRRGVRRHMRENLRVIVIVDGKGNERSALCEGMDCIIKLVGTDKHDVKHYFDSWATEAQKWAAMFGFDFTLHTITLNLDRKSVEHWNREDAKPGDVYVTHCAQCKIELRPKPGYKPQAYRPRLHPLRPPRRNMKVSTNKGQMDHEQDQRLNSIQSDAIAYARIESKPSNEKTEDEREWGAGILRGGLTTMTPGEIVYFCQNVVSNMKNHQSASDALTALANRLIHR